MNWLIYIGGGFLFMFFGLAVFNTCYNEKKYDALGFVLCGMFLFSTLLIWIWICWKFI